jgi:type I restriction enzyme R subunit
VYRTRLFDGKEFFTIYDYVDAFHHFSDPEWDGEPLEPEHQFLASPKPYSPPAGTRESDSEPSRRRVKVKLRDGKEREIQHMVATSFWSPDGKPISAEEFLNNLFGDLPNLFRNEEELRTLWSSPLTRRVLLDRLDDAGYGRDNLVMLQKLIDAEKSDLFDVLEYVFNGNTRPITREARVAAAQSSIIAILNDKQKEFIDFVLDRYVESGVDELDQDKLPVLLVNKYQSLEDAKYILGDVSKIRDLFVEFQRYLYKQGVA